MEYDFKEIERKWQNYWRENGTYRVEADASKPKFYVLDMFPYPFRGGGCMWGIRWVISRRTSIRATSA